MNIYESECWISDLDEIIAILPELEELCGKSVMITGCNGLICSALVDVLIRWNETHSGKINIIAAGRSKEKIRKRFFPYDKKDWFNIVCYDASSTDNDFYFTCDYIIHGASNASPNKIIKEPVETMMDNFIGMKCLLDYARKHVVKRVVYISTSEVYGKKGHNESSKIDDYGGIDILNPRNSYAIGKCAAETLCVSYYKEYGVDSVIVRPGHIYGPTATISDNRVSSIWAYAAAKGEDIIMKSDGAQIRSYCYCLDCASAILKVLLRGDCISAYNISNVESVISILKLAEILSKIAGIKLISKIPSEDERNAFNPMRNSSLDCSELQMLGWKGLYNAERGIRHTIKILKDSMNL